MKIRRILAALLTFVLLIAAAGCSNGDKTPADDDKSKEKVELSFLYIWPEYQELMDKTLNMFKDKNPNVDVKVTVIPWNELTKTLQTSFAAGNAPDVTLVWPDRMASYEAMDAPLDLTSYLDKDKEWKDSLVEAGLEMGKVGDKYLAIPFRGTTTMLAYNKTLLEENNWDAPKSLEEFEALADKMVAKGIQPLAAPGNPGGFQVASLTKTFVEYELLKSGDLFDPEYVTGHKYDYKTQFTAGGAKLRDWYKKGYIGSDPLAMKREESQALFYSGKAGFIFMNNNELASVRKSAEEANFKTGFMAFPAPQGQETLLYNMGVDGFFANKKTQHPEESVALLKFLTSKEVQDMWAKETLSVMAIKGVNYEDADQKTLADIIQNGKSSKQKYDFPIGSMKGDEDKIISEFLSKDSMTPEELGQKWVDLKKKVFEENATK